MSRRALLLSLCLATACGRGGTSSSLTTAGGGGSGGASDANGGDTQSSGGANGSMGGSDPTGDSGSGGVSEGSAGAGGTGAGGTDAGGAGTVGTNPGGAASGGEGGNATGEGGNTSVGSVSDGIACFRYLEAQCDRIAECKNRTHAGSCLDNAARCPGLVIREGSTRTNESLLACAEEWRTFDCDLALRNAIPDCATPGTVPDGEACSASIECQSHECGVSDGASVCLAVAESGGACDAITACPRGELCVEATCEPFPLPELDDEEPVLQGTGGDCLNLQNCELGLYCAYREESPDVGECDVAPGDGEACAGARANGTTSAPPPSACNDDSYCGMDELCHTLPDIDEPCGEARYNGALHCAPGGYCDRDTSTCQPWPALGEPCEGTETVQPRTGTPISPHCDVSEGALCTCPEAAGENCAAEALRCLRERHPGDACDPLVDSCYFGSECVAGVCDYLAEE